MNGGRLPARDEITTENRSRIRWYSYPILRNALLSGTLATSAFILAHIGLIGSGLETAIFFFAIILGGYHWALEGVEGVIKDKKIGLRILALSATIGAALLGMWDEATFLVVLFGIAEGVEEYTYAATRGSIAELLDLAPKEATVIKNGVEVVIDAKNLNVGDIFLLKPGDSVPTDGVVIRGVSSVNEAPVTGESTPVTKRAPMKVFAGTLNIDGSLEVEATTGLKDNTLARIVETVEKAQGEKSHVQSSIEAFGAWYSPLILLSSFFLTIIPPLIGYDFNEWAARVVVLLVAAEPGALLISTPIAVSAGIGHAGKRGVLIKGGIHLENLGRVKAIAFDKTGTLTEGELDVTDVLAFGASNDAILTLAYAVENHSEHPIANAIVREAKKRHLVLLKANDFKSIPGSGAVATVDDVLTYVGSIEGLKECGVGTPETMDYERLRNEGKTVFAVARKDELIGLIAVLDRLRPNARIVIETLHSRGIKTIMLTGDNKLVAKSISGKLGIDDYMADLKPDDKVHAMLELKEQFGMVAMVGDGINDAPVLAQSDVGIAMGTIGSDVAIEAADVALMADDLTKVIYALDVGSRVRRISNQNVAFSYLILVVLIPSALIGILSVSIAVSVHEATEFTAVVNGLRAGRDKAE